MTYRPSTRIWNIFELTIVVTFTFFWQFAPPAYAECTVPSHVCSELSASQLVFLGEVREVQWESPIITKGPRVAFRLLERFKGAASAELVLQFSSSPEEFSFSVGDRVLVYARSVGDGWSAACSRSRKVAGGDSEVEALRQLVTDAAGAFVYGSVSRQATSGETDLRDTRVRLTGVGIQREISTQWYGQFELGFLPAGKFEIRAERSDAASGIYQFVVPAKGGCLKAPTLHLIPRSRAK